MDQLKEIRYEVINDYPNSRFKIGEILIIPVDKKKSTLSMNMLFYIRQNCHKYPHLFKRLK